MNFAPEIQNGAANSSPPTQQAEQLIYLGERIVIVYGGSPKENLAQEGSLAKQLHSSNNS